MSELGCWVFCGVGVSEFGCLVLCGDGLLVFSVIEPQLLDFPPFEPPVFDDVGVSELGCGVVCGVDGFLVAVFGFPVFEPPVLDFPPLELMFSKFASFFSGLLCCAFPSPGLLRSSVYGTS